MATVTILVADEDRCVRDALRTAFEAENWSVREACDRATLFDALEAYQVDLVTLDLVLGAEDGLPIAHALREKWDIPILMISSKTAPEDRIRGLECGADDYIVKPFHIREVVLRVRKALELYRREISDHAIILFDHAIFDAKRGVLTNLNGSSVDLTGLERKLLALFVQHPGRILTRDEICQALHGRSWSPEDRTIDGHVARLRRKIEPTASSADRLIRSVRGVGYVFTGRVRLAREQALPARKRGDGA
ncbi:response regulator transcription factor [Alloyangia pacifica]|uniref:response regulator transcription factor n=1 Tax=Alloyangia pacifica TaxID=311180 RepID=UPI001CFE769B|nr:response regulator transcription factor [Alloyangia pacifica]